jgi:tRNA(Ile)-lysidine synthase
MVLLHAAARVARSSVAIVATFDHGTGSAATKAANLVARTASALGFPLVVGRATRPASTEAEWRAMRLEFLGDVARSTGGEIATAHTRDDQVETVLIRVLRDAGARGLAGLFATSATVRPLLDVSREAVTEYAKLNSVRWVEDPSNASSKHLRNRVRRDLLPAMSRVRPDFEREVLALAREAADWRTLLEQVVSAAIRVEDRRGGLSVPADALTGLGADELAVVWPVVASHAGVTADWRGTERASAFIHRGRVGARVQLSGGWELARTRDAFELRSAPAGNAATETLCDGLAFDSWTFHAAKSSPLGDAWTARLPNDAPLTVRRWQAGDRLVSAAGPRRVKRFLSDAGISGSLRERWPVVVSGSEVVWIPGIRRGHAAAERPGRPGVLFRCELNDR